MSDDRSPQGRFDPEGLVRRLQGTPLGERLDSRDKRRRALFDMLANHKDPMWREIGQQLKNGQMKPTDLLTTPAYRQHLLEGLEAAKEQIDELPDTIERGAEDPDAFAARVEAEAAAAQRPADPVPARDEIRTCPDCGRVVPGERCPHCFTETEGSSVDSSEGLDASRESGTGVRTCPDCGRAIAGDDCPRCF
jgi:rubrerythrin